MNQELNDKIVSRSVDMVSELVSDSVTTLIIDEFIERISNSLSDNWAHEVTGQIEHLAPANKIVSKVQSTLLGDEFVDLLATEIANRAAELVAEEIIERVIDILDFRDMSHLVESALDKLTAREE